MPMTATTDCRPYLELWPEFFDTLEVKGSEFIRRVEDLARRKQLPVRFVPQRGKGSHGTLYYGQLRTVVPNLKAELKKGTLHAMLKQLGIEFDEFQHGS